MPRGKKKKVEAVDLPSGGDTVKLSPTEIEEFRSLQIDRRVLQSEATNVQLRQQNYFLKLSIRLGGRKVEGCSVDLEKGLLVFPGAAEKESTVDLVREEMKEESAA